MSKKKAFILRINEDLLKAIEKWSEDEFRSTNAQIEYLLHQSVLKAKRLSKKTIEQQNKEKK
ncbi:MAG: Arc family DNA binding domain-containing protein [Flavobacteriia bacterium]|nr:Arc family DNA binding domain-containing protein [Flavobacteriia bacterium]